MENINFSNKENSFNYCEFSDSGAQDLRLRFSNQRLILAPADLFSSPTKPFFRVIRGSKR
jgi:hypothetical protein